MSVCCTRRILRGPSGLGQLHKSLPPLFQQTQQRRPFVSGSSEPTTVTASRVLPYSAMPIFEVVADVQSYSSFLPFITSSQVLKNSPRPDSHYGRTWPALATLKVGFQDSIAESYTSRVYCVPPYPHVGRAGLGVVEAISGSDAPPPTFGADEDISHYDIGADTDGSTEATSGPLAYLKTRWSIGEFPHKPAPATADEVHAANLEPEGKARGTTNVHLAVEFKFKNPMYELISKAATPKIAEAMIEAFEKRVQEKLGA